MGKKAHGRLLHEIRDALIRHGFKPTTITTLETPERVRGLRVPGFTLRKHNDGKSVLLTHRLSRDPVLPDRDAAQALGQVQMRHLARYHAALEPEGFVCVDIHSRDPVKPYALWRRADEGRQRRNERQSTLL